MNGSICGVALGLLISAVGLLWWDCCGGIAAGLLWECSGIAVGLLRDCCEIAVGFLLDCCEIVVGLLWD